MNRSWIVLRYKYHPEILIYYFFIYVFNGIVNLKVPNVGDDLNFVVSPFLVLLEVYHA